VIPRILCIALLAVASAAPAAVPFDLFVPTGDGICPVAVIGHAYQTDTEHYGWLAGRLAAAGWIVAVPSTQMSWSADPDTLADDMLAVTDQLRAAAGRPTSTLYGRVGDRFVAIGHSLGGAAAVRAAAAGGFDGLVTMAVLEGGRLPTSKIAREVTVPTLMLAAAPDCVTPLPIHEFPVWEKLGSTARIGVVLAEGSHCGFAGPDPECLGAEIACGSAPTDSARQRDQVAGILLPWLAAFLEGDPGTDQALAAALASIPDAQVRGDTPVPTARKTWGGLRALYR